MNNDHALTPNQVEKIKEFKARLISEPENTELALEWIETLFKMHKFRPGLTLLDRLDRKNMTPENYALRIRLCNYLLRLFDPKDAPQEYRDRLEPIFGLLKEFLPDAMYGDAKGAYILFETLDRTYMEDMALYFLEKAAELGCAEAQCDLGRMYAIGENFAPNPKKAFDWTLRSALQNHPEGLNNLGTLYYEGIGTPVNFEKAYKYLWLAYQYGSTTSLAELGLLLYEGKGTKANPELAHQLWLEGKQKEEKDCGKYLDHYFPQGLIH